MRPTVAIVGPGAIGTAVAAALHKVGRTPVLCGRTPRETLTLRDGGGLVVVPGPVRIDPAQISEKFDLVFLCVKTTQVSAAAPWLAALCRSGTVVCVSQNGIEQEATVAPYVPECAVLPAVVWFPAQMQSDGSVLLRDKARMTLPNVAPSRVVIDALSDTQCSIDVAEDFTSVAWRKLLQNALAGLMALSGRRSGMFARADIVQLSLDYLGECLMVARAEGAILDDGVAREILKSFQSNPSDMGTSILADREANRPLEWNSRNGVVTRRAKVHGIATPVGDVVVSLLAAASEGPG